MPKFRFRSDFVDVTVYDGELVGLFDPVFGKVIPQTCPDWFPALTEEVASLALVEPRHGGFISVEGEGLFFGGKDGWRKIEPASRIIRSENGDLDVLSAADFLSLFEPA